VVQPVSAWAAGDEVALGTLTVTAGAARLKIRCGPKTVTRARIGMDLPGRDRSELWEQLVFVALWLSGVLSVGYCLKTALALSWAG